MTVWSISFQLPLFIRSFSGCAWVDWQHISEIHRTFLKKSYCRTMYSNSLFQKSPIHYIVFKLNAYMAWKCRSLFCQIPSEIPSQTLMSFRNYKRIMYCFSHPKVSCYIALLPKHWPTDLFCISMALLKFSGCWYKWKLGEETMMEEQMTEELDGKAWDSIQD